MCDNTADDCKRTDAGGQYVLEFAGKYKLARDRGGETYSLHHGPVEMRFRDTERDGDTLKLLREGVVIAEIDGSQLPIDIAATMMALPDRSEARS